MYSPLEKKVIMCLGEAESKSEEIEGQKIEEREVGQMKLDIKSEQK